MRYIYVDESGDLRPGNTGTWVLARYTDPFKASIEVDVAWRSGADRLTGLRRLLNITLGVAPHLSQASERALSSEATHDMREIAAHIPAKPRAECHTTDVAHVLRRLNSWVQPSAPPQRPPLFRGYGTIGMELAQQATVLGPVIGALAQTIATNNPPAKPSPTVARLLTLRAELSSGRPSPVDDNGRFDLLIRTLAHGVRLSLTDVLVRGIDEADRLVAIKVHGDAAQGETMDKAAQQVIAAGVRRLLITQRQRYQATLIVDGVFNHGMALKEHLADPGHPPLLTGVVAANSSGTPLIWVSDVAAYALNRQTTSSSDYTAALNALVKKRLTPHNIVDVATPERWHRLAGTAPLRSDIVSASPREPSSVPARNS